MRRITPMLVAGLLGVGCGGSETTAPPTQVPVSSVEVAPGLATMAVGQSIQLTAVPKASDGSALTGRAIAWASGDAGIATVTQAGVVTALALGEVMVTAASEGKSGAATVTVSDVVVVTVEVVPGTRSMAIGEAAQLTAVLRSADGTELTDRPVSWATSDPTVATVSGTGLVTGMAVGEVTITATSGQTDGAATVGVIGEFYVRSPDTQLMPGEEIVYCYYFRTPNGQELAIKTWRSRMTAGVVNMMLFLAEDDVQPPGTQSAAGCGYLRTVNPLIALAYTAYQPEVEFDFPADDGTGRRLASCCRRTMQASSGCTT